MPRIRERLEGRDGFVGMPRPSAATPEAESVGASSSAEAWPASAIIARSAPDMERRVSSFSLDLANRLSGTGPTFAHRFDIRRDGCEARGFAFL